VGGIPPRPSRSGASKFSVRIFAKKSSDFVQRSEHFGAFGKLSVNLLNAGQSYMNIKTWYVYMLLCDEKTFYVGITPDISSRLIQHKRKQSFFTKKFSHIKIVYCEKYQNELEATTRERQLKGWTHTKKQMLIDGKLGINRCTEIVEALGER